jgi:FlaA1/EpsC-like NDP-sugar epimerase
MVPHLVASPNGVSLIAQGAPIPAVQYNFSGVSLSTKKVALLVGFTRELFQSSNADALVRAMLAENLARLAWTAFCSMQPRATLRVRQVCATALLLLAALIQCGMSAIHSSARRHRDTDVDGYFKSWLL